MRLGLIAACFGLSLAVAPTSIASAGSPLDRQQDRNRSTAELERETGNKVKVVTNAQTGLVRFVGTTRSAPIPSQAGVGATPEAQALGFLAAHGAMFGVDRPEQLRVDQSSRNTVRFQQVHEGIPVVGGELVVNLDGNGNVLSANGEVSPDLSVDVTSAVDATAARRAALTLAAKSHAGNGASVTEGPALWIYDPQLLGGPDAGPPRLVWRITVAGERPEPFRDLVLVDASSGGIALQIQELAEGKDRQVCDRNNVVNANDACTAPFSRVESQPATGNIDVDRAYDFSGDTYEFYLARFGRDSLNGAGMSLKSTVRYCPNSSECPYANAYWNGQQMVYGAGFAFADDVVGHELTHGVTEFESRLFYYYQSGAINESLSDVFGEFIDLSNGSGTDTSAVRWLLGEDLPVIGAIRNMKDPPAFGDPDRMQSTNYATSAADSGGVHTNSGVNNKAAFLMTDGGTFNGKTVTGLGIDKTARIYYQAATTLLTSAADYNDLYFALQQACTNLVGTAAITSPDCAQVTNAVAATQMNQQPPAGATAIDAPVCPAGKVPVNLFLDDMENTASGNWTTAKSGAYQTWAYPQNPNIFTGFDATYATSGVTNIFGADINRTSDATIARTANVVPPVGRTTYLHFRHAFGLEQNYDGGRVEYSTTNGSSWTDAGPLFVDNGYTGTATSMGGGAFTGQSHGHYSSRANLTSLAGQSVRFRFHLTTDNSVGEYGWFIDDVRVYWCNTAPVANAGPDQSVAKSTPFTLDGSASTDPDGDPITYAWLQLSGAPAVITDPTQKFAAVSAVGSDSRLVFLLTVTDSNGLTHTDTVEVKVGNPK